MTSKGRRRALATLGLLASIGCASPNDGEAAADETSATSDEIVNGKETNGYAAVGFLVGNLYCTGTLIAPQVVVTATHCVHSNEGNFSFKIAGQTIAVDRWFWHGGYNGGPENTQLGNAGNIDIAIVHLATPVKGVKPVRIRATLPKKGTMVSIVGFGVPAAGGEGGTKRAAFASIGEVHDNWFYLNGKSSACTGDSGGPAFVTERSGLYLVGVFSRMKLDCTGSSSYMSAPLFADWIESKSNEF